MLQIIMVAILLEALALALPVPDSPAFFTVTGAVLGVGNATMWMVNGDVGLR